MMLDTCGKINAQKLTGGGVCTVSAGSPSRGGDVALYIYDINQPSLLPPFYSVVASVSAFMVLSTVFYSINSLHNSPLSHSVLLLLLLLPYWSF